jgi:topoisomerase-4 subunit A
LAGRKIWYDPIVKRLNENGHGRYLGEFQAEDKILCVFNDGSYEHSSFDLTNHFDDKMIRIEKLNSERVYACIHFEGKSKNYYIKRFTFEDLAIGKRTGFISEEPGSKMILLSNADHPIVKIESLKGKSQIFDEQELDLSEAIEVKGLKAQGNKLSPNDVQKVTLLAENNDESEEVDEEITEDEDNPNDDREEENSGDDEKIDVDESEEPIKPKFESVIKEETKPVEPKINEIEEEAKAAKPKIVEVKEEAPQQTEETKEQKIEAPKADAKPPKKVDFEITNPDDIKLDDKGQLGLF